MSSKVDLDNPNNTVKAREVINKKSLLRFFYDRNYTFFQKEFGDLFFGRILELGSGAGYIKKFLPNCITSDVLDLPFIDMKVNALEMPFENESLVGICMIDVFHHIPDVEQFLREAVRVLKTGGKIVMVEPANTRWGRFIYQKFHHEPFLPEASDWKLPPGGPLSMANGALPWIVFQRDWINYTSKLFPDLKLLKIEVKYPLIYLLSGGLSWPQLMPKWVAVFLDKLFPSGMFYEVVIEKK
jgi:SAM-dependent methyltransferase